MWLEMLWKTDTKTTDHEEIAEVLQKWAVPKQGYNARKEGFGLYNIMKVIHLVQADQYRLICDSDYSNHTSKTQDVSYALDASVFLLQSSFF